MSKIYKVTLKTTNSLKDTAQNKWGKYLDVEDGVIYVLEQDIDYFFKNYNIKTIEYAGIFFSDKDN